MSTPPTDATPLNTPETGTGAGGPPAVGVRRRLLPDSVGAFFQTYGVLIAFAALILFFSLAKPEAFPTLDNVRAILAGAAALAVMSAVLTVPMTMGDFDLSIGFNVQVLGAIAVTLMASSGFGAPGAIAVTILAGAAIGTVLGALIAWSKVSAFVITLGAGILLQGIELRITDGKSIFEGLASGYAEIANKTLLSFNLPVWIALAVCLVLWYVTRHTVIGRFMAAVGGNQEAARLSGIHVERMRTAGFLIVGVGAAVAGVIITAQAASAYPNSATGLLIPAYAAVFLGAAVLRPGQFHIWGTLIGVMFMATIQNGLTLMNYSSSTTNIIQGAVFIAAVLVSRIGSRR